MIKPILIAALLSMSTMVMAADNSSSQRYTLRVVQEAHIGVVLSVRPVDLVNDNRLNTYSVIGSSVGYGASRSIKNRDARKAGAVLGAALGGVAGTQIQRGLSKRKGYEIFIRDLSARKGRELISIVQAADSPITEGDYVFITGRGNKARVVRIPNRPTQ